MCKSVIDLENAFRVNGQTEKKNFKYLNIYFKEAYKFWILKHPFILNILPTFKLQISIDHINFRIRVLIY